MDFELLRGRERAALSIEPEVSAASGAFQRGDREIDDQRLALGEIPEAAEAPPLPDPRARRDLEDRRLRIRLILRRPHARQGDCHLFPIDRAESPAPLLSRGVTKVVLQPQRTAETRVGAHLVLHRVELRLQLLGRRVIDVKLPMQMRADGNVPQLRRRAPIAQRTVRQHHERQGQIPVPTSLRIRAIRPENARAVDVIDRDEFARELPSRTFRRKLAGRELEGLGFVSSPGTAGQNQRANDHQPRGQETEKGCPGKHAVGRYNPRRILSSSGDAIPHDIARHGARPPSRSQS